MPTILSHFSNVMERPIFFDEALVDARKLLQNVNWLQPLLYVINQDNVRKCTVRICLSLGVNQKYHLLLKEFVKSELVKCYGGWICYSTAELITNLVLNTTYVTFPMAFDLFYCKEQHIVLGYLLNERPTVETLYDFLKMPEVTLKVGSSDFPMMVALNTKQEDLIVAVLKELYNNQFPLNATLLLCKTENVRLINAILAYQSPAFVQRLMESFAVLKNPQLFQLYYSTQKEPRSISDACFREAVRHGNHEIVKFCLEAKTQKFDYKILLSAYFSGSLETVNLIKALHTDVVDLQMIAKMYCTKIQGSVGTMNNELLFSVLEHFDDKINLPHIVGYIVMGCLAGHMTGADAETFRILSSFAPDLELTGPFINLKSSAVLLCLQHFKKTPVPNYVFTREELLDMLYTAKLDPSRLSPMPMCKELQSLEDEVIDFIDVKRTVYLFLAKETELRDIVEIVLEYL